MNERRLRPVYLIGIGASAYALWYYFSVGATVSAVAFGLVTAVLLVRLRIVSADE